MQEMAWIDKGTVLAGLAANRANIPNSAVGLHPWRVDLGSNEHKRIGDRPGHKSLPLVNFARPSGILPVTRLPRTT